MSKIYQIFQQLRALRVDDSLQRESRAMFVAQVMAYQCPLDIDGSCEAMVSNATPDFRKLLSEVNEYIAVDTRLAQTFFEALLKARYEVATGEVDPTLMRYLLMSNTQDSHLGEESAKLLSMLLNSREYCDTQRNVHQLLNASTSPEE